VTTHYNIFLRPVGERTWTQHLRAGVPFRTERISKAVDEAQLIMTVQPGFCTLIAPVDMPEEPDTRASLRVPQHEQPTYHEQF
jgi:hypothetical protein